MKTNARLFILLFGLFLLVPAPALAVPACPDPVEITQPTGGPPIKVFLKGMEWNNWVETKEGYTIARDNAGNWRYVKGYEGEKPVLDSALVGQIPPPAHLSPKILPSQYQKMSVNSSGHEILSTYNVLPEKELEESASADFAPYGGEISQVAPKGHIHRQDSLYSGQIQRQRKLLLCLQVCHSPQEQHQGLLFQGVLRQGDPQSRRGKPRHGQ